MNIIHGKFMKFWSILSGILEVKLDLKYKNDIIDDITVSTARNTRLIMSDDVYIKKSLIEN